MVLPGSKHQSQQVGGHHALLSFLQIYRRQQVLTHEDKSKASISAKNQWGAMKLQLDVKVMMNDLHGKNQLNICKRLAKIAKNCLIAKIY